MYEKLTEKFLSMKWDKNYITNLNASKISEDTVVSILDDVLPEWTFKITHMIELNGGMSVGGTLFLPGRTIDGTGSNEWSAICNIISKLTANVNNVSNVSPQPQLNTEAPKQTTDSVQKQLQEMKNKVKPVKPVDDTTNIFNDLMGVGDSDNKDKPEELPQNEPKEEKKEENEFLEFGTPECDAYEKEFWDQVNAAEALKTPTPEEVNPNHIVMRQMWNDEQGAKLRQWATEHNVAGKEQMSAWFKRYCGLEYDYFNPEWVDKFILWTKALREKQTY